MPLAVQFGAGNIGRGFMGQLFWEAGYHTCFVEYSPTLAAFLNTRQQYPLRLLDAYSKQEIDLLINQIDALTTVDYEHVAERIVKADAIGTAVGVKNLESIAPLLAAGITQRRAHNPTPVDIYLCENMEGAAAMLKGSVLRALADADARWAEDHIGFVGTSVARMVPAVSDRFGVDDPLFVVADAYHQLPYDGPARRGKPLAIEGMYPVNNFRAEVERKLFTHNLGHAALAYLGFLKGMAYVHESFDDPETSAMFEGALDETARALVAKYPDDLDADEHRKIRQDVRIRFGNPMILDTVQRVARDPIRKLGPQDRLIGSAALCREHGIAPDHIATVCGAAYCYAAVDDPDAVSLQAMIRDQGIANTMQQISGVEPDSDLGTAILAAYHDLRGHAIG